MRAMILSAILLLGAACNPASGADADSAAQAKTQRCAELSRQLEEARSAPVPSTSEFAVQRAAELAKDKAVLEAQMTYEAACKP